MCGHRRTIPLTARPGDDPFAAPNPDEPHQLEQIDGSLYRFTVDAGDAAHSSLVLVTPEGVVVTDPVRTSGARWLREEIRERFDRPVRYVIYSHAHFDHIGGAHLFAADGATIIAHENAVEAIIGERLPTAVPTRTFRDRDVVRLGGETIELTRVAPCHSNSMILLHYPDHRMMQAVDFCPVGALPYNDFLDFYYDGWVENLRWLEGQDFDRLEGGHYEIGGKAEVGINLEYVESLHAQVLAHVRAGRSWDELYRRITFAEHIQKRRGFATMRFANILGMYRWVHAHRRGIW